MAYHDAALDPLTGILISTVDAVENPGTLIELTGQLHAVVSGALVLNYIDTTIMTGVLSSTAEPALYKDTYAGMYGFLSARISGDEKISIDICPDLTIDMEIQSLDLSTCKIGDRMKLTRYRGDNYPLQVKLSKNGNPDITGHTFKMSTKIEDGAVYTSDGTILDASKGLVSFPFDADSVNTAGSGVYDIQGDDGHIYTYVKGVFDLLDDVTP